MIRLFHLAINSMGLVVTYIQENWAIKKAEY